MVFWLAFLLFPYLFMFYLVPSQKIVGFLPLGLFAGFVLEGLYHYVSVNIFYLWIVRRALLTIAGIPYLVLLARIPLVIIFASFLPTNPQRLFLYIPLFAFISTFQQWVLTYFGLWLDIRWGLLAGFFLYLTTYSLIGIYLIWKFRIAQEQGDGN